jgi:hypothetical protein
MSLFSALVRHWLPGLPSNAACQGLHSQTRPCSSLEGHAGDTCRFPLVLSIGSSALVKTVPMAGKSGQSVLIFGNNLAGTAGDFQRRRGEIHGRVRYLHQGDGSDRRDYWLGFCRDADGSAQ